MTLPPIPPPGEAAGQRKRRLKYFRSWGGGGGGRIICRQKRNKTQNKSNHSHTLNAFFPCGWSGVPLPAWRTDLLIRTQFLSIVSISPMSCVSVLLCTISQNLMSPVCGGLGGSIAHPPPMLISPPPPLAPFSAPKFKTKSLSTLTYWKGGRGLKWWLGLTQVRGGRGGGHLRQTAEITQILRESNPQK